MASTPSSLWMNTQDGSGSISNSPRPIASRSYASPTRITFDNTLGLTINLKRVLGTTVSSVNGFDCLATESCFATCAGSTAVLHRLQDGVIVSQRHFRARPNAASISSEAAQPGTPDWRGRQTGSVRASNFGVRGTASPSVDAMSSPGKSNARQRTRAATCLSLSPDGRTLVVGETGHVPRILFFSLTDPKDTDVPYTTLSEHSYGVRCLAFSSDSRWLCSIGDIHDGFVFLWSINQRNGIPKLHASNKCTSIVHDMVWLGNNSIVTVGTRHVKLWRPDSLGPPSPSKSKFRADLIDGTPSSPSGAKTLPGRNCLLGSSLESTFTCAAALSDSEALVCSDRGDICLLDDTDGSMVFMRTRNVGFAIKCLTVDVKKQTVWIGGSNGEVQNYTIKDIKVAPVRETPSRTPSLSTSTTTSESLGSTTTHSVALGIVGNRLVAVDSNHHINIYDATEAENDLQGACLQRLPAHSSPVLGCDVVAREGDSPLRIVTWDSTGMMIFWSPEGEYLDTTSITLDQAGPGEDVERNELKLIRFHASGTYCLSGDRHGILRVLHGQLWRTQLCAIKAHGGEVNDIAIGTYEEGMEMIATCSRDRTVQIYRKKDDGLDLIQTIDHHASSVNHLLFLDKGRTLCSASSDRTVVVHTLVVTGDSKAYIAARIMTTKQSPISIAPWPSESQALAVTTVDKQLHKFDLTSGLCSSTIRLWDESQGPVTLASLSTRAFDSFPVPARLAFGISATDKSVRLHDLDSGITILRDYGHSEGLTKVTIIEEGTEEAAATATKTTTKIGLASTGLDGTILLWEVTGASRSPQDAAPATPTAEAVAPGSQQPLRRVLSKSAIAEFSKTLEANGIASLPPTPTTRNPSPSRLRKKPSKYSIGRAAGLKHGVSTPPPLRRPNRSPSPPSPALAAVQQRRPLHRMRSVDNFSTDAAYAADQLTKAMRAFRKKMASSSSSSSSAGAEALSSETLKELEKELNLTARVIGGHSASRAQHRQSASERNVGDLLDEYSDRLAQMVQEKVNLGAAGTGRVEKFKLGSTTRGTGVEKSPNSSSENDDSRATGDGVGNEDQDKGA